MEKHFLGASDTDLVTSLVDSFLYEETKEPNEISVTYLHILPTSVYVCRGFFNKKDLLDAFETWVDKELITSAYESEEQFKDLEVQSILLELTSNYCWEEFNSDYDPYTLEEWYKLNKNHLSFELDDLKEYLCDRYGINI